MVIRHLARASVGFLSFVAFGLVQPAQAQNWDGSGLLRFGVFMQGAYTDYDTRQTPVVGSPFSQTTSPEGYGVGLAAGYDLRFGRLVVGIEGDLSLDNSTAKPIKSGAEQYGIDYLAMIRGRLGAMVAPDWMIYGTGGLTLLGAEYKLVTQPAGGAQGTGNKKLATLIGWAGGGGVEYDMNWATLFGEYLYANYGSWDFQNFNGNQMEVDASGSIWRLGLKFKIGHDFDHDTYRRNDRLK